jgi:hypothetical protein
MSTPKTTFLLTDGTTLTDIYPLESNGVNNLSVPTEIIDIDSTVGGVTTVTVIGDLSGRLVSVSGSRFAGAAGSTTLVYSDGAITPAVLDAEFEAMVNSGLVAGAFIRIPAVTPETQSPLSNRVKVLSVNKTARSITVSEPLLTAVTARLAQFLTPFSIIDLDPLTPSPYVGEYGAAACMFNNGATTITLSAATPIETATFDIVGVTPGTNGVWMIQGLTNARDVFYPTSTFTVAGNSHAASNSTYTVGSVVQSGSYNITDIVVTATGSVLTIQGNVGEFFTVSAPLYQQLRITANTSHSIGIHPLNGTHDITAVSAYNAVADSTTVTIGTIVTGTSGLADGKVSPAIPTTAVTVSGLVLTGAQADGAVKVGAPTTASFVNAPTITPTTAHNYIVTWYVSGNLTSAFAPGASVTIKNNNYYSLKRLTVIASSFDGTNTSVQTNVTDPGATTPVIGSTGAIVYPAIPVPYGHIQYSVLSIASSLQLVGRGVTHYNESVTWGQSLQNNAIHQLENFANATPPVSPLTGQLWFDTATPALNVRTTDTTWSNIVTAGLPVQGDIDMAGHTIGALANLTGLDGTQAVNMQSGDDRYVNVTGDAMTGALDLGNNAITGVADINQSMPQLSQAMNVKSADLRYVHLTGDMMLGDLSMSGSHRVVNMANPSDAQDAATKSYVDSLSAGIVWLQSVLDSNLFDDSLSTPPVFADPTKPYYRSYYVKPAALPVTGVNDVTKTWRVAGDHTTTMAPGETLTIYGNGDAAANGTYTVATVTTSAGDTLITVDEPIPSTATISGTLLHASGSWNDKLGCVVAWDGSSWIDVLGRAAQPGDRFGVFFEIDNDDVSAPTPGGSFTTGSALGSATSSAAGKIVAINTIGPDFAVDWGTTSGSLYPPQTPAEPDAVSVLGTNSLHYGHSYTFRGTWGTGTYNTDYKWIEFAGPAMLVDGSGLRYTGNILNVGQGAGITVGASTVSLDVAYTDSVYMRRDGSTAFTGDVSMGGHKLIQLATPTIGSDAVNLQYLIDNYVATTGTATMFGDLDMGNHLILNVANPLSSTDAVNKAYADTKVAKSGDTMTGPLVMSSVDGSAVINMSSHRIINLADPINGTDAVNMQTADGRYVNLDGDTMIGPLSLASDPTQVMHAATKQYVDATALAAAEAVQLTPIDGGSF